MIRSNARRRRVLAVVALGAVVALTAAACTTNGRSIHSLSNSGGGGGGGGTGGASGADQPGRGISATSVKLGITNVDLSSVSALAAFHQVDYGTPITYINAIVNWVNKNGGAGGRQIQPDIQKFVGANDSPTFETAFCTTFTQDNHDFAVVLSGQFQQQSRACYAQRNTIMIDNTFLAEDKQTFDQYAPYLWSPTVPAYDSFVTVQLQTMKAQGYFDGATGIQLGVPQTTTTDRITKDVVEPLLKQWGVPFRVQEIDQSNVGSLSDGANQVFQDAQQSPLFNRVMIVGGARILPLGLGDPSSTSFSYKLGMSSFDNPAFIPENPLYQAQNGLVGSSGISFNASGDLNDQDALAPFPGTEIGGEQQCYNIVKDSMGFKSTTTPTRENYSAAMTFCDSILFFKAVLDSAQKMGMTGDLSPNQFKQAEQNIGSTYTSAVNYAGSSMQPGNYAITVNAKVLNFSKPCSVDPNLTAQGVSVGCFTLGASVPVPSDAASASTSGTSPSPSTSASPSTTPSTG